MKGSRAKWVGDATIGRAFGKYYVVRKAVMECNPDDVTKLYLHTTGRWRPSTIADIEEILNCPSGFTGYYESRELAEQALKK